jgi:pyruvate formate lyase activating enzyme
MENTMQGMDFPARHWRQAGDGRLDCLVCPRACRLGDGQRGACFVRVARGGRMVLDTYGRSSGFCVDPIEKKPLYHFLPGTPILSFGTAGCNLSCRFCQNWELSHAHDFDRLTESAAPETIARAALDLGCRSVAFTYNDPVIFLEYAVDVARACRERGIKTVAVTAGSVLAAARADLFGEIDAANVDLKSFSDDFYRRLCGGRLEPVKETLAWLAAEGRTWLEITTLLIPGENDSPAEIEALSAWVAGTLGPQVPVHFSAFHPAGALGEHPPTPPATLSRARSIARANGLAHVYTGNVIDPEGGTTYCSGCGRGLIGRDRYRLTSWALDTAGRCVECGTALAGLFEPHPGGWGARRLPVRLGR